MIINSPLVTAFFQLIPAPNGSIGVQAPVRLNRFARGQEQRLPDKRAVGVR
jgi:hypothetical protein